MITNQLLYQLSYKGKTYGDLDGFRSHYLQRDRLTLSRLSYKAIKLIKYTLLSEINQLLFVHLSNLFIPRANFGVRGFRS
jgi:hypothetical protein